MNKVALIIPARLGSIRLPNKPIALIHGIPMVCWVAKQAVSADIGDVYIGCCSDKLAKIVQTYGYTTIITDPNLPSGTDRVYAASVFLDKKIGKQYDVIVNVQGDMPFVNPDIIRQVVISINNNSIADIVTPVVAMSAKDNVNDPNIVKAVIAEETNYALYFTRAAAPFDWKEECTRYKHLGIYAFKYDSLKRFVSLSPSKLELSERLEQLRALENGMKILVTIVKEDVIAVDTQEDLENCRKQITEYKALC